MKIADTTFINTKKLKARTGKALFLIVPIAALITLSTIISSQAQNFQEAADKSIFGTIEEQSTLISIRKSAGTGPNDFRPNFNREDSEFTESDLAAILAIDNVETAAIVSPLPITNMTTSDLFDEATIRLRNISGIDETTAALYTEEDFGYTSDYTSEETTESDAAIPIILNANTFTESYEDWGGETEIEIDMRSVMESGGDISNATPFKTRAISYEKADLIGQTFTVQVAGLEEIQTFTSERGDNGRIFKQKTEDEIASEESERRDTISEYWNYDTLNTPIEYTFEVAGIIEDEMSTTSYIPEEFADQLMQNYIQHQLDAKNNVDVPTDDLNSIFVDLTYDGLEIESATMGGMPGMPGGGGMGVGRPPGENTSDSSDTESETYLIPGLVVELSDDDSEEVIGIYQQSDAYNDSAKTGDTLIAKVTDVYSRQQVIDDLNEAGYAYQDLSNLEVFSNLESTLNSVTFWLIVAFVVLTVSVIILTMSKFVSDSAKEIGIFRAIGMTKADIRKLFVSQAVLYTLAGYAIGLVAGIALNLILAGPMKAWFDSLVGETIKETFNVVNPVDASVFTRIDWTSLYAYSILLIIIAFIVSFVPATKASSVSPVEAIREG